MSSIADVEKRFFEALFRMRTGYVLDYTDATFDEFFRRHQINIHGQSYQTYGTSKARKMRAFWEQEPDNVVAPVLGEMLDSYEADCAISGNPPNAAALARCREAVSRLKGAATNSGSNSAEGFLSAEFTLPDVSKLPVEPQVATIIEDRLREAQAAFSVGAYLSVIFQCGSVLEAVLLGAALRDPARFNQSNSSPKGKDGKVERFDRWKLAQFIDTAHEVGVIKLDVKKFSHGLRDFRNYIHPYEQMSQRFSPDEHTAKVCFQVLGAALADVAGDR